jgi:hypothetical protein
MLRFRLLLSGPISVKPLPGSVYLVAVASPDGTNSLRHITMQQYTSFQVIQDDGCCSYVRDCEPGRSGLPVLLLSRSREAVLALSNRGGKRIA